jgi:tRNA1Val (adenine37-N6)-methyltransferase
MRNKCIFTFKHFTARHDRVAMKVGTDGVLLGAWAAVDGAKRILDVGTGSGLIALMVAQRTVSDVSIDAIEMTQDAIQAKENFEASPWSDRIRLFHANIRAFEPAWKYDLIITNPPYFTDGLHPPGPGRKVAKHGVTMNRDDIIQAAKRLLNSTGRISLILPIKEGIQFADHARDQSLHCIRRTLFRTRPEKAPIRFLLEFSFASVPLQETEISLYDGHNKPSAAYRSLTADFYLNF